MTETSDNRLESVLAGIRSYLTEQLSELDNELEAARRSVLELSTELALKQTSVETLLAGRELLTGKLSELDAAVTAPAAVAPAAPAAVAAVAAVVNDAVAVASEPVAPGALNASQREVLAFLETTPGVHKVAEITAGVSGAGVGAAAAQAVRRALAVLTKSGHAAKSAQSGTAFYSAIAATEAPAPAKPRKAAAKKSAAKKSTAKKATVKKAAPEKVVAAKPVVEKVTATKPVAAKPAAAKAVAEKPAKAAAKPVVPAPRSATQAVRADRAKIVETLQAAAEPQSAGEVSRTLMGDEWRPSDATNFRNVLKSLTAQGLVAEHRGEDKRARYTAPASS